MGPGHELNGDLVAPLLPPGAVTAETSGDREVELYESERRALGNAVPKRRREFVTGRALAREALGRLGVASVPIDSGPHGAPCWPPGVVGSITHCAGYRACAVAWNGDLVALGIDVERDVRLDAGVWADIAVGTEYPLRLRGLDTAVFSVKEAIYKALHPLSGLRLDFTDAEVALDEATGTFRARVAGVGPLAGRWGRRGGLVAASLALRPDYSLES